MIDRWYATTCDTCGTTTDVMPTASESRELAANAGWTVNVPNPTPRGPRMDFCPDHKPTGSESER